MKIHCVCYQRAVFEHTCSVPFPRIIWGDLIRPANAYMIFLDIGKSMGHLFGPNVKAAFSVS